ncbi:YhfH-like protein [Alteribacillus persepolensis]|uniref:YhfH-like protein n=1 Tax=Alteribacillus persepolensis TaxID=568899 RepID=A0A1G7ZJC6_9BACI|nr:protein YhfH [Alteribacillus persepolensis]SDH08677.1 YhfH-like protein [Alteribacillus persepolensis]
MEVKKITEFFRNLPPKQCEDCGDVMDEMHESYMNKCDKCLRKAAL